jgi:hypothetical protein
MDPRDRYAPPSLGAFGVNELYWGAGDWTLAAVGAYIPMWADGLGGVVLPWAATRGVAQWQSTGLQNRRSGVRIPPPLPDFQIRDAIEPVTSASPAGLA